MLVVLLYFPRFQTWFTRVVLWRRCNGCHDYSLFQSHFWYILLVSYWPCVLDLIPYKHCVATVMSINVIVLVHRSTFRWMSSDPKACSLVPRESGYPQWYFNDLLYCLLFMAVKTLSRLTSSDKILTRWEYNSTVYWFKKLL